MAVLFFTIVLCCAVIGFSVTQVKNTSNLNVSGIEEKTCTNDIVRPFRYTVGKFNLMCAWSTKNSAIRILIGFGGALIGISLFVTVIKRKKVLSIIFNICLFVLGGLAIYSTILDGKSTNDSKKFCESIISAYNFDDAGAACSYQPIYITILLNAFSGVLLIITSILIFRFKSKVITGPRNNQPVVDDIDYNYKYTQTEAAVEEKQNLI